MPPRMQGVARRAVRLLELLAPRLAGRWACARFFAPPVTRRGRSPRLPGLQQYWQPYTDSDGRPGRVCVYAAGSGPAVMLVHGWGGAAASFETLGRALLAHGFRVVLFDYPAHGMSPGRRTNIVELAGIVRDITAGEGELQAIIAHSFGAMVAGWALRDELPVGRLVTVSAPVDMAFVVSAFCAATGATDSIRRSIIARIETLLVQPYETASLLDHPRLRQLDGMIVHDRADPVVPCLQARHLRRHWPRAVLCMTRGLGHGRILRDRDVTERIVKFLQTSYPERFRCSQ